MRAGVEPEDDGTSSGSPAVADDADAIKDPVRFVREVLGEQPYDKQESILKAVARRRRVSVVGCNGSGKDWAAARVVLWWMHSRSPVKALVTGPTTRQVDDIVWREIKYAYSGASGKLPGRMYRRSRYELDDQSFALGFATDSAYNLQGFHSPNLLVVVTEAHAVGVDEMNAIRRLNPKRLLMTGNPFATAGDFYDSHHSKRDLYRPIQISAFDTPNVKRGRRSVPGMITRQDIADRRDEWGENSSLYIGSVLARFPDNPDNVVVPLFDATEAARRQLSPDGPVVLACDVARFGHDKTVVIRRQGPVARIVWRVRGHDTMRTVGYLKSYCDTHDVDVVVIDESGVGGGVVDRLRELKPGRARLVPFLGAKRAQAEDYFANRIAEVWWAMRDRYIAGEMDTDEDDALIGQVSSRTHSQDSRGRIVLQSKRDMPKSPDEADALAMTFAVSRKEGLKLWV